MAKSLKGKASYWYGYLKAGARSSAVLRDERLDTRSPKTLYMFNLERGEIIEYSREIVEKKLRELKPSESETIAELDAGYKKARRRFKGHSASIHHITDYAASPSRKKKAPAEENDINETGIAFNDADIWADAEEVQ